MPRTKIHNAIRSSAFRRWGRVLALLGSGGLLQAQGFVADGPSGNSLRAQAKLNDRGDVLVCDRLHNRVIELNPGQQTVWQFGDGGSVAGPTSVVGPTDAMRIGQLTFICGTGLLPGETPDCPYGCQDNRVIAVDSTGTIVWQYGQAGVPGSCPGQLNRPTYAVLLDGHRVLITDQGNHRVILVDWQGNLLWQYGMTGMPGSGPGQLDSPSSALHLVNNHYVIADTGNNRVVEVNPQKQVVWEYQKDARTGCPCNGPTFASRESDGNTLICDTGNNRVLEVDPAGTLFWLYNTSLRQGSVPNPRPSRAVRLRNGHILISDQFNQQVIEITQDKQIVYTYGTLAGATRTGVAADLNGPHDAKAIGDFTGLPIPCPPK